MIKHFPRTMSGLLAVCFCLSHGALAFGSSASKPTVQARAVSDTFATSPILDLQPSAVRFALPIIKSEGLPAEPSRTRFHDVADDRLELIENALVDLRKRGRQPLAADRGKTYRGIVPIFLSKPSSLGAAP